MHIRPFCNGDEPALHAVFYSAVHEIACRDYTLAQRNAWAPREFEVTRWVARMQGIQPFVVECEAGIIAYADLQANGYIDHFYVASAYAHRGVGTLLMTHLLATAQSRGNQELISDVSLTAQRFFAKFGFVVEAQRTVMIGDIALSNARMKKILL